MFTFGTFNEMNLPSANSFNFDGKLKTANDDQNEAPVGPDKMLIGKLK